jgi:hypothetical protein
MGIQLVLSILPHKSHKSSQSKQPNVPSIPRKQNACAPPSLARACAPPSLARSSRDLCAAAALVPRTANPAPTSQPRLLAPTLGIPSPTHHPGASSRWFLTNPSCSTAVRRRGRQGPASRDAASIRLGLAVESPAAGAAARQREQAPCGPLLAIPGYRPPPRAPPRASSGIPRCGALTTSQRRSPTAGKPSTRPCVRKLCALRLNARSDASTTFRSSPPKPHRRRRNSAGPRRNQGQFYPFARARIVSILAIPIPYRNVTKLTDQEPPAGNPGFRAPCAQRVLLQILPDARPPCWKPWVMFRPRVR